MSLKQVNELFEFPLEGTIGPDSFKSFCEGVGETGFVAKHFWKEVFYPKGETGQVATNDFRMLWWFVHGDPATMGQLDFGRFLIAAFIWERDHNTGSITMGSFITVFAKHFGVALLSSAVLAGHALLDIRQMEHNYKWLVHRGDKNYEWFFKREGKDATKVLYANLPCPATHLSNPNALLFKPGPAHPYSRMSRSKVFDPQTPPLAPVTTREFRLFMDCFTSFSQDVIAQFDALERRVVALSFEVVSLHQQLAAFGPTASTADVISEARTE
ncbi:Uncharacterized protein RDABS01_026151 [Bienertia sinuspersici]